MAQNNGSTSEVNHILAETQLKMSIQVLTGKPRLHEKHFLKIIS